jgi:hypothetical protein
MYQKESKNCSQSFWLASVFFLGDFAGLVPFITFPFIFSIRALISDRLLAYGLSYSMSSES